MYEININKCGKIHFIGIGGISMSSLAHILLSKGRKVSGSDAKSSPLTKELEDMGAEIFYGQRSENIKDDVEAVVYTAAISEDNPELMEARKRNLPLLSRAQFLGQIMTHYNKAIGVSGTHGKTTTTSMISEILLQAKTDPTILVGGILNSIGGNYRIGSDGTFITEACEYTNSFLSFAPTVGVILNISADHLDFFKDLDDIRHSFKEYAKLIPEKGSLVINHDIENLSYITNDLSCKIITFSTSCKEADYYAEKIEFNDMACAEFDLMNKGNKLAKISLKVPGIYNVGNALAAAATCLSLDLSLDDICTGLEKFSGADRRFQKKGEIGGVTIIDDYAHHPDEIKATLTAAKNYPHKTLWCVFQPHTYTRTKALMDEFAEALAMSDKVVLANIYAARETDTLGISSADLQKKIQALGKEVYYFPSFDEIESFLLENCAKGDLLITMGAGDVVKIGENLLGE